MTDIQPAAWAGEGRATGEAPRGASEDAAPAMEAGVVIDLRPVEVLALDPGASFADAREHGLLVPEGEPDVG